MEDMERYADYNEVDDAPAGKNPVVRLLKMTIIILCLAVVGFFIFRVIFFNYYPKQMKNIYFNDTLTEYYESTDGEIGAVTQTMRAPYDDADLGNFFADNLIVIRGAGQLQLSVRYNESTILRLEEKYGISLDGERESLFTFELERVPFDSETEPYSIGRLDYIATDSKLMYTYHKLVFDGVTFAEDGEYDWIRLKITINGAEGAEPHYILVYEVSEENSQFSEYKLSKGERP